MKIGVRIMPSWFKRKDDLRFLQQIGVDCVNINLVLLESYQRTGIIDLEELTTLQATLDTYNLPVERAANMGTLFSPLYLNEFDADQNIERIQQNISTLGRAGIPIMAVPPFGIHSFPGERKNEYLPQQDTTGFPPFDLEVNGGQRSNRQRRGGYGHPTFHLAVLEKQSSITTNLTHEIIWERMTHLYESIVPVAQEANVKLTMHGNDPPLKTVRGCPQIMTHHADFDELFKRVPNAANGMTYCVGTRYEAGEDVIEGIRHFGQQNRLFHVHLRNVEGTLPDNGHYAETFIDDGDINIKHVFQTLKDVDFKGAVDFDHVMHVASDSPNGRQYVAFTVGYFKAILTNLSPSLAQKEL